MAVMGIHQDRGVKRRFGRGAAVAAVLALGAAAYAFWPAPKVAIDYDGPVAGWERWGGGDGGTRYSPLTQITPDNVAALQPAWTYHIGEIKAPEGLSPTFEATPITAEGRLYVCSGSGRIAAIDPETGREIWAADPQSDYTSSYLINCRGVTYVRDRQVPEGEVCAGRIFAGTVDDRLVSLDAKTGKLCGMFGAGGILDLKPALGKIERGDLSVSSPPVVVDDRIVVNSRVSDNIRVDMPAGVIRAFDVHSGKLAWAWNAVPPGMSDAADAPQGEAYVRATPNSWAPMSADPALGLVFVPMGNAAPDHFGGDRKGLDYYASSVVALDAKTGEARWHFQTVHHDLWDYDIPAQPVVFDLPTANGPVPALAQTTKQGHIFILDRRTGKPLYPVEERPVPQAGAVPGEKLSPTQPFPANPAFIIRSHDLTEADMWGFTPWDRSRCRKMFKSAHYEGIFTPPSLRGSIQYPSFQGASNWGGITIDPERAILIANTQQVASIMQLVPRDQIARRTEAGEHILPASGSPYGLVMKPMLSPLGAPCNEPPWGTLVAIDLAQGKRLWEVPLGTTRDQAPFPIWLKLGVPNLGGSIVTASGLVFIGATTDDYLRAYDIKTGDVLWRARLPGGGQATPMTYRLSKDGRQYVVIAAGGHKYLGTTVNDTLVAYALPR
ncbi:MAG: pyrroloquinoline quinone-dependent dehydrogenase [Novosphingobium sp.]|nr:pyrroloquinoline quinone-dependent dehydrogenase [Novosphingobium sp.]